MGKEVVSDEVAPALASGTRLRTSSETSGTREKAESKTNLRQDFLIKMCSLSGDQTIEVRTLPCSRRSSQKIILVRLQYPHERRESRDSGVTDLHTQAIDIRRVEVELDTLRDEWSCVTNEQLATRPPSRSLPEAPAEETFYLVTAESRV